MRVKKKELRKRQPQLPINYPDPEVLPKALPGAAIDVVRECAHVEVLCKRLAHNEVVVRDAALADVPRYLERVTQPMRAMERAYAEEVRQTHAYYAAHPRADRLYDYDHLPLALARYRAQAHKRDVAAQRRHELQALRQRRAEEARARATHGRFDAAQDDDEHEHEGERADPRRKCSDEEDTAAATPSECARRERYEQWMRHWCDIELVFLKLSRGIFFCLWHSDKPLVQLSCAERIAALLHAPCTTRCKVLFYSALLRVLSREWPVIDHYRLDKFMALVRKMLYTLFAFVGTVADNKNEDNNDNDDNDATAGATRKRARDADDDDDGSYSTRATLRTVEGIVTAYTTARFARRPVLCEVLRMLCFLFHEQLVPVSRSVGLTMHMCDVAFDELCRAQLSPRLFISLSVVLPLYAMSRGNYVEKRVLDNFFPPIVGGVLLQRRGEQELQAQLQTRTRQGAASRTKADRRAAAEAAAQHAAAVYTQYVIAELAQCCKAFAVARGTAATVRVLFSEAELVLQQSAQPEDSSKPVTRRAQHRRMAREVDEVNTVRRQVKEARDTMRVHKRQKARADGVAQRRRGDAADGEGGAATTHKHAVRRDTKRKKHYKLTKSDLYGSDDDDDDDDDKSATDK